MCDNYKDLISNLKGILIEGDIKINEPMSKHTTFKIGGPCDIMISPTSDKELIESMKQVFLSDAPYFILGSGSNILVKDGGIRGVVINLTKFNQICVDKNIIMAQAGAKLSDISDIARDNSLSGFSFACGIPGTIGGAINMNAGAYGGEMKDVIKDVRVMTRDCEILTLKNGDIDFGYRDTLIMRNKYLIIDCSIELLKGDKEEIDNHIRDLTYKRVSKQPLEYPSAGSTFKRPSGYFAGKLIEDSGLRGYVHKNVMVSEKHCGFIISRNENATAKELLELIDIVKKRVYNKFNVELDLEVRVIGED